MHHRARSIFVAAAGLFAAASAHAQSISPRELAMAQEAGVNPALEARLAALSVANRELSVQVNQLRTELNTYKTQTPVAPRPIATTPAPAVGEPETVYVTSSATADKRYENWYGLSIGDRWRLHDDTPIKLIEPHADSKLSYKILPAGTVVTIIGAPRGVTGTYAVAVNNTTSGWATLR